MMNRFVLIFRVKVNLSRLQQAARTFSDEKPPHNAEAKKLIPIIDFEDPEHLPLPVYEDKINESLETRKARLIYQSRKRGMLENDILLSTFASKYLKTLTSDQVALYDKLINGPTNDWDIYNWATGAKPTPEEYRNEIMDLFKDHVKNAGREQRLRQPNL